MRVTKDAVLFIRLEPELRERVEERAKKLNLPMSFLARLAIEEWLNKNTNGKVVVVEEPA